jgi:hypothetical protein
MTNTIFISCTALIISIISLTFTIYNILRDRGKVTAWAEIFYDSSKDPDKPPPALRVRVVNSGRRPIVILHIVKEAKTGTWFSSIVDPVLPIDENGNLLRPPKVKDFVAQNSCLTLREGEVFEIIINYDEHLGELVNFDGENVHFTKKLYIEDVLKNRYYVKKSFENIKILSGFKENT